MGQSFSSTATSLDFTNHREIAPSRRFSFRLLPIISSEEENHDIECLDDIFEGQDYTLNIPDECLGSIFNFISPGDRKRCSLVCRRWLQVEGQYRKRLSLHANSEILSSLPSLIVRFDSVTKLALRCDRKSVSINDDALILISLRFHNLTHVKLRGCYELTNIGMAKFAMNCKGLKKLSCGSCTFGAEAMNAVLSNCSNLEEFSVKRLRGLKDDSEMIGPGIASKSLKSIFLRELVNGQCFAPLIAGAKNLKTLKIIRCLGDWDKLFETMRNENRNPSLTEIHIERLQMSDVALSAISNCLNLEILHIVKIPECSNVGISCIAEQCKRLRKLRIDGWRTNRIGDEGLIAIAKQCPNLKELVLIGVNLTRLSLEIIGSNCLKLERLALCGSATVGDTEIACIASKCSSLKQLCIKSCPISDIGISAIALGFPNLAKIKVKKCRGVSKEAAEWFAEKRGSLSANWDSTADIVHFDGNHFEIEEISGDLAEDSEVPGSSNCRFTMLKSRLGLLAGRNFVSYTLRRWSNSDSSD